MSDGSKNFSLWLTPDDPARLEQVAEWLAVDRTGALRLLIRRAGGGLARAGCFIALNRRRTGRDFPVRLIQGGNDGA